MKLFVLFALLAAIAGATQWDPEVRITENDYADFSYWSTQRRVVVDPEGRVHVAWHVMNSDLGTYKFQIYYKRWYPGTGWTADTMLSADLYNASVYCKYASLAVDSAGTVYAAWAGGTTDGADEVIYLKTCVPGTSGNAGWEPTSRVLSVSGSGTARGCPTVAATPDGHVHATWLEGNYASIVYRERMDTTWQQPLTIPGGTSYAAYPAVAGGPDNRVHLIWYGREGSSGFYNVFYKARTDATWGATENVSYGVHHQMYPSLAVNPATADPHVLWQCYGAADNKRRTVHRWRNAGGWQPTDTLSERGDTLNQDTGQLIFTADGRGHALWGGRSPQFPSLAQVRYSERSVAGTWSAAWNLTDSSGSKERPSVAAGSDAAPGDIHVVWTDYRDGTSELYYCHGAPGQFIAEEQPAPRVRPAPATICRGVLFLGAGHNPIPPGESGLCPKPVLLDAAGRKVLDLHPGANDMSRLAPGVYFVERDGGPPARVVHVR